MELKRRSRPFIDQGGLILIVDDEETIRSVVSQQLEAEGFRTTVAAGVREALDQVEEHSPDLILLDHMMPDLNGLNVLRAVREQHPPEELPVIVISAHGDSNVIVEALQRGANDYMTKPIDFPVAIARIRTHLSLKRALEKIRSMAETDHLTGLHNRRSWIGDLKHEFKRTRRYGQGFSVLIMDLDHFKEINDTHGHLSGDRVLRTTGQLIGSVVRDTDLACRYGGEEFAILMPQTGLDDAMWLGQRLRKSFANHVFESESGRNIRLTCSIGISVSRSNDDRAEEVLKRADRALYHAKTSGRNRVERRRSPRYGADELRAVVRVEETKVNATLLDYSREGTRLEIPHEVRVMQKITLVFKHPVKPGEISRTGRVRWVQNGAGREGRTAGVEFNQPLNSLKSEV